ncbi:MAG: poly-beta-1,6 N-acetyl-D-glucosamine export porin PgaA [Gammaproteobacteria bacterium]|nr:poly-beta-1,6 N-acetyl-D-glucosamine export porin PgaA [Gammaproteobacteria bacterium]
MSSVGLGNWPKFFLLWVVLCFLFSVQNLALAEQNSRSIAVYQNALQQARDGHLDQALPVLERLSLDYPEQAQYLYDYITVLGWGEYDIDVIRLARGLDFASLPVFLLETIGKSARNQQDYRLAYDAYRTAYAQQPQRKETRQGMIMALADVGKYEEAQALLHNTNTDSKEQLEWWQVELYVLRLRPDSFFEQLLLLDKILTKQPDNQEALKERVRIANWLGAPLRALQLAQRDKVALPSEETANMQDDADAFMIRWAMLADKTAHERQQVLENIISRIEQKLQLLEQQLRDARRIERLKRDLLLATHHAGRHLASLRYYRELSGQHIEFNATELAAIGDSLLVTQQPDKAIPLFRLALQKDGTSFDALLGLIFAYLENEEHDKAQQIADAAANAIATGPISSIKLKPDDRPTLETTRAVIQASAGKFELAERILAQAYSQTPFNMNIIAEQAALSLWQGQTREAIEKLKYVLFVEPTHNDASLTMQEAYLALYDPGTAITFRHEMSMDSLSERQVRRLNRMWQAYDGYEYLLGFNRMSSDGTQSNIADLSLESWLYTPPLFERFRVFGHGLYTSAMFPQGLSRYHRAGLGLEYRHTGLRLSAEINNSINTNLTPGMTLSSQWQANDAWQFGANFASNAPGLPLRARVNGTRAWSTDAYLQHHLGRNESGLSVSLLSSSDANHRGIFSGFYKRTLWRSSRLKNWARIDISTSRNTRIETEYFNPSWDASMYLTLDNEHLIWRDYEKSFSHMLSPFIGIYKQDNFSYRPTGGIRYQQTLELGRYLNINYGATYSFPVFDGVAEHALEVFASIWGRI